VKTGSR